MFPDYKYSPRKPGQKKKRQSRKATKFAVTAAPLATETLGQMFDFNSFPDLSSTALGNSVATTMTANGTTTNIDDAIATDAAPFDAMGSSPSEFARQGTLVDQFGFEDLHADLDNFMDACGFRNGADMDATLAPFFDPENGLY
jgi:hypothetical protein